MDTKQLDRWLDREMSEAESAAFLSSLKESEQQEVEELRILAAAANDLPPIDPSPDFAARAMARVRARRPPRRSIWTWLLVPAISPATAFVGASAIVALFVGFIEWRAKAAGEESSAIANSQIVSPKERGDFKAVQASTKAALIGPISNNITAEIDRSIVARFSIKAPAARKVSVAGDFNAWLPDAGNMRRASGGVWTLEIPLGLGKRYQYMFVIDGDWITDPNAESTVDDGFGGKNAVIEL